MKEETPLSEQESLRLIQTMINKAKGSYHDTGIGPILWGTVITLCSLISYAQIKYDFELPFDIWLLTLIAIIPQVFISIKESKQRKALNYEDTALSYIWTCFGISIFLLIHININIFNSLNPLMQEYKKLKGISESPFAYSDYVTSIFLLLYGIPSVITGGITKLKPMLYGGILCWACCIITVYTPVDTDMLLTAVSATAAWLIPGIILYKRHKVRSTQQHV